MVNAVIVYLHVLFASSNVAYHSTGHHWLGLFAAIFIAAVLITVTVIVLRALFPRGSSRRNNS